MEINKVIIAGAGPAGMMAAIRAAQLGAKVIIIEKNSLPGRKLLLSGKGRCNLTNACDLDNFIKRFFHGGDFLRDAFRKFFNRDLIDFFEKRGAKLKIERQMRVFPVSDKSSTVLSVLAGELHKDKVEIISKSELADILVENNAIEGAVLRGGRVIETKKLILATGGVSYSSTGSTGDGIRLAQKLGHRVVPPEASLVPLETKQQGLKVLAGLTLKNIRLRFFQEQPKRQIISETGELLFTHSGISGPLVISLSSKVAEWLKDRGNVSVDIDLKPALTSEALDARLLREFKSNPAKSIRNVLKNLLPLKLVDVFIENAKIDAHKKASQVTHGERKNILHSLKNFRLGVKAALPIEHAMVTRGGVSLKDINPRTLESRIIKGLYFAGEIMDVDADTGGFNLQAAFSSGYLAGESAAGVSC